MNPPPEGSGTSVPRPIPPLGEVELKETMTKALAGDEQARQRLIQSHLRLVWDIVRRFSGRGADPEDLFQIGCVGLMNALSRFDPSYGTRFSTYAVPLVIGEIKRFLRDDGPVHVTRRAKELARKAWRLQEETIKATGRTPSAAEIAENLGVDPAELAESLEAAKLPVSLFRETTGEGDDSLYLIDHLASGGEVSATTAAYASREGPSDPDFLDSVALREAVSRLDERSRNLVVLRFFQDRTQAEVGRLLGISQVQVSRLEKRVLLRLRGMLTAEEG